MTTLVSFASHLHPRRRSARKLRSRLAMSTLLMTVAALVGSGGGGQRCAAQPNFPPPPVGGYASDEYTFSIGVAQIQVDPNFTNLFAPLTSTDYWYPGFSPGSGILTSPVMYDSSTEIASSALSIWDLTVFTDLPYTYPVKVGNPVTGFGGPTYNLWNNVSG